MFGQRYIFMILFFLYRLLLYNMGDTRVLLGDGLFTNGFHWKGRIFFMKKGIEWLILFFLRC